jgi:hypothetical protein
MTTNKEWGSSFLCNVTLRRSAADYRRFGTAYSSHLQGSSIQKITAVLKFLIYANPILAFPKRFWFGKVNTEITQVDRWKVTTLLHAHASCEKEATVSTAARHHH